MTEQEKIASVVIMASRKLGHYFKAYNKRVLPDRGLNDLFRNPEVVIIAKWAAGLSGYNIIFEQGPQSNHKSLLTS
jgi:hypothetical protein